MIISPPRPRFASACPDDSPEQRIVVGLDPATNHPISFPRSAFHEAHSHIRGIPGSGKTSRIILPLILQFLEHARPGEPPEPIIVLDMGGDQGAFHAVRDAALAAGRSFRFFSLNLEDDGYFFDPMQGARSGPGHVMHLANMLIRAFNLDYGQFYGGDYFTAQNTVALLRVARQLVRDGGTDARPNVELVTELLERTRTPNADQIKTTFLFLNEYPQLKPHLAQDPTRVIDLLQSIERGEVVYFFMPAIAEAISARPIAGLALYTLQQIAERRMRHGLPRRNCWTFVDEHHEIAGRSFEKFIVQCRKTGINLFLANQNNQQLRMRDMDLQPVVFGATKFKFYFNFQGREELEEIMSLSRTARIRLQGGGETTTEGTTDTVSGGSTSNGGTRSGWSHAESKSHSQAETWREEIQPELDVNDVLDVDAAAGRYLLMVRNGRGHVQPQAVVARHALPAELYQDYQNLPLPARQTPFVHDAPPPATPKARKQTPARNAVRQGQLETLWNEIEAALDVHALQSPPKTTDP